MLKFSSLAASRISSAVGLDIDFLSSAIIIILYLDKERMHLCLSFNEIGVFSKDHVGLQIVW